MGYLSCLVTPERRGGGLVDPVRVNGWPPCVASGPYRPGCVSAPNGDTWWAGRVGSASMLRAGRGQFSALQPLMLR